MTQDTKIQFLPGVGPKMAEKLERLGITTIRDLLFYWPRAWQDFSNPRKIAGLRIDEDAIIKVKINSIEPIRSPKKWMSIINAELEDESGVKIKAIWFNQPYLVNILKTGDEWLLAGKVGWDFKNKCKTFSPMQMEKEPIILPIYAQTEGLTSKFLRKIIKPQLEKFCHSGQEICHSRPDGLRIGNLVSGSPMSGSVRLEDDNIIIDFLPSDIVKENGLIDLITAIRNIHFPVNNDLLQKAKERLAFNELFLIALRFLSIKKELQQNNAPVMSTDETLLKEFVSKLPYKLTNAQRKSAWEIIQDLSRRIPMNRLLEGDVGSGKTVVAAMAALVAIKNKYQVVWLAPTEILSNQHYQNVAELLVPFNIKVGLLTSANKKADLANDDLIIGTHAVIQKNIQIPNLGLIIIDEQHRFGVKQRAYLRSKTYTSTSKVAERVLLPHLLSMTATPIPRTLSLALYGDLDISIIDQMPEGRQKVITKVVGEKNRRQTYGFIETEIKNGRQAFVICPLIEEKNNENFDTLFDTDNRKAATAEFEKLSKNIFPKLKIGLLHGKMKGKEKNEIMEKFKNREIDILVSTAVVEVGIDIANATVMMIESAERFGLAQLHQFRGRVGRGEHKSYCFLFNDAKSDKSKERLRAMEDCFDGFELAQKDLELRGPGEMVGLAQSGLDDLKMAELSDTMSIDRARRAAEKVIEEGLEKYPALCEKLKEFEMERHLE